jgi:RNA recognition motif-containing protein
MNTRLYIGNLSPNTTAEDLRYLFSKVSGVISVDLVKDQQTGKLKGYAFMEMVSQGDVGKAVSEFNGSQLDRRTIVVKAAEAEEHTYHSHVKKFVEYKSYNESIDHSD